jgi:hypothetical protein
MKKLVSLNAGLKMVVREGKKEREIGFTCVLPSKSFPNAGHLLQFLCDAVNVQFDTDFTVDWNNPHILVLKPKRVRRPAVDTEQKIKELGY